MTISDIFPWLILSAVPAFLMPGRWKGIWAFAAILAGAVCMAVAGISVIAAPREELMLPGLTLLGGVFLLAIAMSGVSCSLFAIGYLKNHCADKSSAQMGLHFASLIVLFYSMAGVVTATTVYGFLIWWEAMTLSSFLLVMFEGGNKQVLHASVGYLILMHIGFFLLLGGFAASGGAFWGEGTMPVSVFLLFLAGFGLKAGIFPLHMWLPVAHPAAPSHVSALMSGVMIKMGIFGIIKAITSLSPGDTFAMGVLVFGLGVVTAIFGIVRAAVQSDLKRLLAYSSIENIGIICLGIGLGAVGRGLENDFMTWLGFGGALFHMLGHSNYKTMLFLGAGSVVSAAHTADMNRLGGLLKRMPLTGALFLIAVLAVCAVPPLVGFASEFVLLGGMFRSIASGELVILSIVGILTLALVGGLTIMAMSKAFGITFGGTPRSCGAREATEVSNIMLLAPVIPLAGILCGPILYARLIFDHAVILTGVGRDAVSLYDILIRIEMVGGILVGAILLLLGWKRWLTRRRRLPCEQLPTWGCGFTSPNKHMQYTASSYNRELQQSVDSKKIDSCPAEFGEEEIFPLRHRFRKEEKDTAARAVTHYFSVWLRRWTARLALFQTGKTNHYILHALLLLILILILSLCGVL